MCLNPKKINRNGFYKESTYKGKKGDEYYIECFAKCGYCEECQNEKANNWVIRNYYESKTVKNACFITLTYKDNPKFLIKKHAQDYMKRLRRHLEYHYKITNVRMFLAGEYGTLHHRPHYHIIIYNWQEKFENLKYLDINKKGNVLYESKTVKKTWKFGRTTYQIFDIHEIPYITLYETPKEESSFEYKMKHEKAKKLLEELKNKEQSFIHRKAMIFELEKTIKEQEKNKSDYITFKEFNLWSIALGWDNFEKEFNKYQNNYDWIEYIEDKEYLTPSPWVKKLANLGYAYAIAEMLRRAEYNSEETEETLKAKNRTKTASKHIKEKLEWTKKAQKTIL